MQYYSVQSLIHPAERSWYIFNIIMNLVAVIVLIGLLLSEEFIDDRFELWFIMIGFPLLAIYSLGILSAYVRTNAIELNKEQFPEVYYRSEEIAQALGLAVMPRIFLRQEGGLLNAFAAKFFARNFIQVNSDIFEIAYRNNDLGTLSFIIAHEMAHVKLGHTTVPYLLSIFFAQFIPVVGSTLSRAREYSCDRLATAITGQGTKGVLLLAAGKYMYDDVNIEAFLQQSARERGFWVWLANIQSSHPLLSKRIQAMQDLRVAGKLF